jgi:hypothetical protein
VLQITGHCLLFRVLNACDAGHSVIVAPKFPTHHGS